MSSEPAFFLNQQHFQLKSFRFENFAKILDELKLKLDYQIIKITGTNGKTSTACCLTEMLMRSNPKLKVGLFISPHVLDYHERITINFVKIPPQTFKDLYHQHENLFNKHHFHFFHIFFIISLYYFQAQNIDIAIFELGIGAKYDVVNLLTSKLSIITSISLDHQHLLGRTHQQILDNKKYIVNPNSYCISNLSPVLFKQLTTYCQSQAATAINLAQYQSVYQSKWWIKSPQSVHETPWPTIFQQNPILKQSFQLALIAYEKLTKSAFNALPSSQFLDFYQFRFSTSQYLHQKYIFDGGHNINAAKTFLNNLEQLQQQQIIIIYSAIKHKNVFPILKLLQSNYRVIIFSLPGETSYEFNINKLSQFSNCQVWANTLPKLIEYLSELSKTTTIGVFGSFRLVGLIWDCLQALQSAK